MPNFRANPGLLAFIAALCLAPGVPTHAQEKLSAQELAKLAQNPIANLISVPFQNDTNFNYGPQSGTQNVLNIQPVIPISLGPDWNLITRTILPIITQPATTANESSTTGLGDLQLSGFLSPNTSTGLIWGAGAIMQAPTNGSERLGNDRWGLGPTAVVLRLEKGSPWVYGALVNNVWSVGGGSDPTYNNFLLQPFVNYNLPDGVYINTAPIITANWKAESSQRWTVPLGAGVGKIFHFGRLPVNMQLGAYYNVIAPDNGPDWTIRFQIQFMFPK